MNSNHNNKETFKLLNVSESESGSEVPDLSVNVPRRKIKVKRKYRPGNDHKMDRDKRCCSLASMWKALGVVLMLSLLAAIVTLLVHLYDRNDQLNKRLLEIQAESRQFPEEFHDIHSRLKTLEANGTFFWESVVKINSDIASLSKDLQSLKETADSLSKSIAAAPQIETLPKDVGSLQKDVATMGSKIGDLEVKLEEIKAEASAANKANSVETLQEFRTAIDSLNQSMSQRVQEVGDRAATVRNDVAVLKNSSLLLEARIETLQNNSRYYQQMAEHLQNVISDLMNQSDHRGLLATSPETGSNVTLKQMSSLVRNLTKIYHALLLKMSKLEADMQHDLNYNLLNTNVTDGLESMMQEALEASEQKILERFSNESLHLYIVERQMQMLMLELNKERNSTSQLTYFKIAKDGAVNNSGQLVMPPMHQLPILGPKSTSEYLWLPNSTTTPSSKSNSTNTSKGHR